MSACPKENSHPACLSEETLLEQCDQRFLRRSGPGGQHRNKVETAVQLTHRPTGLTAEANERRSQRDNHRKALLRLRLVLATQIRFSAKPFPTPTWQDRCQQRALNVASDHRDFPALLAELLDILQHFQFDNSAAAAHLGCSTSQLVKLCKKHRPAFEWWNQQREERGLRRLR